MVGYLTFISIEFYDFMSLFPSSVLIEIIRTGIPRLQSSKLSTAVFVDRDNILIRAQGTEHRPIKNNKLTSLLDALNASQSIKLTLHLFLRQLLKKEPKKLLRTINKTTN